MSNFLTFICTGLLTLTLSACNHSIANEEAQLEPAENLKGKVSVWVEMPPRLIDKHTEQYQTVVRKYFGLFRRLYPNTEIAIEFIPPTEADEIYIRFEKQSIKGLGPNILVAYFDNEVVDLIRANAIEPLNDYEIDWSVFRPEAVKQVLYKGKYYALPINLETQVLCYNTDKVKQVPKTLDDLVIQARQGYSVGLHSSFLASLWGIQVFGGEILNEEGQFVLDQNDGWKNWMNWLKVARDEPNFSLTDDIELLETAFIEGRLAYTSCLSSWIPYYQRTLGKNKVGVTLLPGKNDNSAGPPLYANLLLFNAASSRQQMKIAVKLGEYLINKQQQRRVAAEEEVFIPSVQDATVDPRLFPVQSTLIEQSKTAVSVSLEKADAIKVLGNYGDSYYRQVLAGALTPEQAARELKEAIAQEM